MEIDEVMRLADEVGGCEKCPLFRNGKPVLSRSGPKVTLPIELMIIGEAPGAEEAAQGLPFVGRSGELLDQWLKFFGVENYIIANVIKHRPPENRKPTPEEISACSPYLLKQIEIFRPRFILCVGDTSFRFITKSDKTISHVIRSKETFDFMGAKVFVYFHPAYILRHGEMDWQNEIKHIGLAIAGKKESPVAGQKTMGSF